MGVGSTVPRLWIDDSLLRLADARTIEPAMRAADADLERRPEAPP